jgi:hypothetical protein
MEILPTLFARYCSGSFCNCHTDSEDRVCTKPCFILGPVECDHLLVDLALIQDRHALESGSDELIYIFDSSEDPLAKVALHISITQFYSFMCTS